MQLTEALAEYGHRRVRQELRFPGSRAVADEARTPSRSSSGSATAARFSLGHRACPKLAGRALVVELLDAGRTGLTRSEELQLHPEQATDAIVAHTRKPGTSTPDTRENRVTDGLAAVLWDMDGTLVDSEKLWDVALYECAEWLGGSLTTEQRLTLVGSNMDATASYLLTVTGHDATPAAVADTGTWIRERTATLFADELPWRPGAREALAAVKHAGVPSALVTSTERALTELALDTIGRGFFAVTVCGDEVDGRNKPLPEPYLRAARLLGTDPSRCVAVEDSPPGAESAAAAGCTVLVVPNDVAVPDGPRRVFRSSLTGVDADTLRALV